MMSSSLVLLGMFLFPVVHILCLFWVNYVIHDYVREFPSNEVAMHMALNNLKTVTIPSLTTLVSRYTHTHIHHI